MSEHPNGAILPTCGTCRHFRRHEFGKPNGACHRNPPTALVTGMIPPVLQGQMPQPITNGFWAPTNESEACGEHSHGPAYLRQPSAPATLIADRLTNLDIEGSA